ncbi:hypothetical protein [Kitasatospora sp. NPDC089509]|uniref:hypothetical protein n=1 Tax=Kitasatospora sp. NPDC089509 TaxID=3364079 RepID=UPI00380B699B
MKHAPTAMVAGKGPDGEPLVYVFYSNGMVRRILQGVGGGPMETWSAGGVDHPYPFRDQGLHYRKLWTSLTGVLTAVPVAVFRRDEEVPDNTYTFHALVAAGEGKYQRISWNHTVFGKQHVGSVPFSVPAGFAVTAACEISGGDVVLWGLRTTEPASAYCVLQGDVVGAVRKGPLETAVTAAFLGYDKSGSQHVTRLYAGADGKEESAYTVEVAQSSCVFTPLPSAPRFLAAAESK